MVREGRGLYPGDIELGSSSGQAYLTLKGKEHAVVFVDSTTIRQSLLDDQKNQS